MSNGYPCREVTEVEPFWRRSQACVDYEVFVCDLPNLGDAAWRSAVTQLRALGVCSIDVCGITTVRGGWGFFLIPGSGYPEMKITFFKITSPAERQSVLDQVAKVLRASKVG